MHNAAVKGSENSRHMLFCACDCVLDLLGDGQGFRADAKRIGLIVVEEAGWTHLQTP
jgi:hypothetical protein